MKKVKYPNWLKRSSKFVPFDFFSSDPGDWSKYISDPDCPPHFLSTAWHEIKQDMKELKRKWIDDKDYLYTDTDHRERSYWCNRISDTVVALVNNKSTPDDVVREMSIVNWEPYRKVCGMLRMKFPHSFFADFLLNRNNYENYPYLFDYFLNIINRNNTDSDFNKSESDQAIICLYSLIDKFSSLQYNAGELIGDDEVFRKYMEKNQLKIVHSIDRFMDTIYKYLSNNKEKMHVFIDNQVGISYAWKIIDKLSGGAAGYTWSKSEEGSWKSIRAPKFSLDLDVVKSSLTITEKMINFIKNEPELHYMLDANRLKNSIIYSNRINYVKYLLSRDADSVQ